MPLSNPPVRSLLALAFAVLILALTAQTGVGADDAPPLTKGPTSVQIKVYGVKEATSKLAGSKRRGSANAKPRSTSGSAYTYVPKADYETQHKAYQDNLKRIIDHNNETAAAQDACTSSATQFGCNGGTYLDMPADFNVRAAADSADPAAPAAAPVPVVSPQQAAYIASARLRLTAPKPMIGPPPSINKWKMAAVGYPMWLWADGNLNPAPVSDSVYDLAVSLDARLVKVVYEMGDGQKVTCTDVSRSWNSGVPPAAESPVCGYTYEQPSLPSGEYTITANAVWAVDWTVNNTTGTIPFFQSASTQLPVGELQVLNR